MNRIITFCCDIDSMLNGGIPLNKITEFCGVPGIGKTQMGFQLSVNTTIPEIFGGVQGKTIYIDTEGSFSAHRIREMSIHLIDHLKIKLIVIDSIAYPFRKEFSDLHLKTRLLLSLAQNLMNIAETFNLAIVLMNQVTTKITTTNNNNEQQQAPPPQPTTSILVPALGENWAHI
eukprot:gene5964-7427_t